MKENLKILQLKTSFKNQIKIVSEIKDIPEYDISFLLECSAISSVTKRNKFQQDLSYEMHIWYLFFMKFLYNTDRDFVTKNILLLNARFGVVKRYFHKRVSKQGFINKPKNNLVYFVRYDKSTRASLEEKIVSKTETKRLMNLHNKISNELSSTLLNQGLEFTKSLVYFFNLYVKQTNFYFEKFDNQNNKWSIEKLSVIKHRFYYSIKDFETFFIEGMI